MTVIVAQLQVGKSIHCTDSLLTTEIDGKRKRMPGSGMAKILECPKFNGAISWWGRVETETWNARDWLLDVMQRLSKEKELTVDLFADSLADELGYLLKKSHIEKDKGVGLHFTNLEDVDGVAVPELFLITNYAGMEYDGGPKFVSQRQTFHSISGNKDCNFELHYQPKYRKQVLEYLRRYPIIYSNGQPRLFGALSSGIKEKIEGVSQEKQKFWMDFPLKICKDITALHRSKTAPDQRLVSGPYWEMTTFKTGEASLLKKRT